MGLQSATWGPEKLTEIEKVPPNKWNVTLSGLKEQILGQNSQKGSQEMVAAKKGLFASPKGLFWFKKGQQHTGALFVDNISPLKFWHSKRLDNTSIKIIIL